MPGPNNPANHNKQAYLNGDKNNNFRNSGQNYDINSYPNNHNPNLPINI